MLVEPRSQSRLAVVAAYQLIHVNAMWSSNHLCDIAERQDWRDTWLAVGLWTEDMVLLQSLSEAAPCGEVDCADIGQPRSLVAADMGGTIFLCVGSSQGWVAYHPLVLAAGSCCVCICLSPHLLPCSICFRQENS